MKHKIMRYMAIFIALMCAIQIYFQWGTDAGNAFIIALCGWLPHCFEPSKISSNG